MYAYRALLSNRFKLQGISEGRNYSLLMDDDVGDLRDDSPHFRKQLPGVRVHRVDDVVAVDTRSYRRSAHRRA